MPLPVISDTIRCTVYGTSEGGANWSNTFHVVKDVGHTYAAAIADLHVEVAKLYSAAGYGGTKFGWSHFATNGSSANTAVYTPLDGSTPSTTLNLGIAGQSANEPLPPQDALVITFVSDLRGRSYRGRNYWGGIARDFIDSSGKFAAADIAFVLSCWVAWAAAISAYATIDGHAVASYLHATETAVTSYVPRAVFGHQTHRRGPGA